MGFNEAGAITPRKEQAKKLLIMPFPGFNEAGAITPRKEFQLSKEQKDMIQLQ